MLKRQVVQGRHELARSQIARRAEDDKTRWLGRARQSKALAKRIGERGGHVRSACAAWRRPAWLDVAAHLSLAAGYAGPLFTKRAVFGPAGRRRSLEECRAILAPPHTAASRSLRER